MHPTGAQTNLHMNRRSLLDVRGKKTTKTPQINKCRQIHKKHTDWLHQQMTFLSNPYFWVSSTNGFFMNLTDNQITFLCVVISVRNGSVCKAMPEKWGMSKNRATVKGKKLQDKHSKFPQSCNLDTIKMQYFFPPKEPWIIAAALHQDKKWFGLHRYTTQPPAFCSLSAYPKLYLIASISVGIVKPAANALVVFEEGALWAKHQPVCH